ncbi:hypothetical protein LVY72_07565 [Arthrobacter sp. I2-34]|uniref:Uncharacterized protein n=1 Tax=Arthrobacter hankyongi TaxID=2904801 RepID=A0ABS9L527_9MICC|nr:hypothetical protein [Arthrobacter hankyongi]MCG2621775.1 hypothetical protein [Arthrobacter hankyongi]
MTKPTKYRRYGKGYVFNVLRREILAARLKVTLDKELGRPTSDKVKRLAAMDLPPIVRSDHPAEKATGRGTGDPANKDPGCGTRRRGILAARLKVAFGELLGRAPSPQMTRLSRMKLAPIAGRHHRVDEVAVRRTYDPTDRDQVLSTLRSEILAAQLKETLDELLGRETSPAVKRLARMKLPRIVRTYDPTDKEQVLSTLRGEILAAQLKETLDEQLGRKTSPAVKRLARMELPPVTRANDWDIK